MRKEPHVNPACLATSLYYLLLGGGGGGGDHEEVRGGGGAKSKQILPSIGVEKLLLEYVPRFGTNRWNSPRGVIHHLNFIDTVIYLSDTRYHLFYSLDHLLFG